MRENAAIGSGGRPALHREVSAACARIRDLYLRETDRARIRLTGAAAPLIVLPELAYEGADLPLEPSTGGPAKGRVRHLRDPAIYREAANTYLLYSVAGEHGIAIAELH